MTTTENLKPVAPESAAASGPGRAARKSWARRHREHLISALLVVVTVGVLETGSRGGWIDPVIFPSPSAVLNALRNGFSGGLYWPNLWSTVYSTIAGFGLAMVVGLTLGGLLASVASVERVLYPYIVAFQSTPKIAIAPLIIIWFGFGQMSKVTIVMVCSFFPIVVNTMEGLRLREAERLELGVALGATRWQLFRYIRLPGSMPYVFAGLQVASVFALLGAVVAEFIGARSGLGVVLLMQQAQFDVPGVYAVLLLLMCLGLVVSFGTKRIERRVTFWARERDDDADLPSRT